jgi:hypothetical protein
VTKNILPRITAIVWDSIVNGSSHLETLSPVCSHWCWPKTRPTDIPPVSSLSERRKLGLILAFSVPRVRDLRSGSPQEGSARVEYSKVVFATFNASRTPENLL